MRKFHYGAVAVLSMTLFGCNTPKPAELDVVVDELMAIDAKVEIGINQIDYAQAVQNLNLAVKKYQDTPYAEKNLELTSDIENAFTDHVLTLSAWQECSPSRWREFFSEEQRKIAGYCWEKNTLSFQKIISKYPDIQNDESIRKRDYINEGYFYNRDMILKKMFNKNSNNLANIKQNLQS